MQQNIMHKDSPHPSTAHYQLEFVLIHGGTVFDAGSVIGDGGDVVGLALGGHGGEERLLGERMQGGRRAISYLFSGVISDRSHDLRFAASLW
jgi:hypothetical protein